MPEAASERDSSKLFGHLDYRPGSCGIQFSGDVLHSFGGEPTAVCMKIAVIPVISTITFNAVPF